MEQLFKELVVGIGLPTAILFLMIKYIVIPLTKKYIEFVDKAIRNMDEICQGQAKMVVAINKISDRLDSIDKNTRKEDA